MKQIICFLLLLCCSIAAQAQDPDLALLRKAQAGDADAQYELAQYYLGQNNIEKYVHWLTKAANNNNSIAMANMGFYYQTIGDKQQAIHWYKKYMDMLWQESHEEDKFIFNKLQELGVTYHPANNVGHSDKASRNSSVSTVKGNSSTADANSEDRVKSWNIWFEDNLIGEWNYIPKEYQIPEGCLVTYRFRKDGAGYRGIYSDIYSDEEHFHWKQENLVIFIQYKDDSKEIFIIDPYTVTESKMIDNKDEGEFHRLTR